MYAPLDVLQVGDNGERHDDQQRPGTPFAEMHGGPGAHLVRVLPDAEEGADVLGEPDEEADQHERDQQRHAALAVERAENDGGSGVKPKRAGGDVPAVVADVVMGEEVGVDQQGDQRGHPVGRVMLHLQVEQAPRLDDVAAHGRVHEPREQRNAQHLRIGEVRIGPRLDSARCLEDFEGETDQVEHRDRLEFVHGFQLRPHHPGLNGDRDDKQGIIARHTQQAFAWHQKHGREEQSRKQARTCLLDAEIEELERMATRPAQSRADAWPEEMVVERA